MIKHMKAAERGELLVPTLRKFLASKEAQTSEPPEIGDAKMTIDCFTDRRDKYAEKEAFDAAHADWVHPSQVSRCIRDVWLQYRGAEKQKKSEVDLLADHLTFEIGTYTHVIIQNLCERAGVLVQREVPILDQKWHVVGNADGIIKLGGVKRILEIKTISAAGMIALRGPKPDHKRQMMMYSHFLGKLPCTILYVQKDRSELVEYSLEYDAAYVKTEVLDRITAVRQALTKKVPPKREGVFPDAGICQYCRFKKMCWDDRAIRAFVSGL